MKQIFLALNFCILLCGSALSQETVKFDEFGTIYCDDYLARMDHVFLFVKNNPSSKIYVFVYEGKVREAISNDGYNTVGYRYVSPKVGEAKAIIRNMKKLIYLYKQPIEQFVFVEGGFRDKLTLEFWNVSNGTLPPKPTPSLKKMKYQKGKAKGFCISM